jgi:hypothetical protein
MDEERVEEEKVQPEEKEYLNANEVEAVIERIKGGESPKKIAEEYGVGRLGDIIPPEKKEEYNRAVKVAATKRYKAKKAAEPKEKPEPKREAAKEVAKERVKPKPREAPAEERISVSKDNKKWIWIVAVVAIAAAVYLWRKREEAKLERGKRLIDKAFGQENPPQPPQPPEGPQGPKSWRSEYGV